MSHPDDNPKDEEEALLNEPLIMDFDATTTTNDGAVAVAAVPAQTKSVIRSSIEFKTDIPKSSRVTHPSGILHATRSSPTTTVDSTTAGTTATTATLREEHCFAYLHDKNHLSSVLVHLSSFGFEAHNTVFIPYSNKVNWVNRYPVAFPYVECDEGGTCVGFPYWSSVDEGAGAGGSNMGRGVAGMRGVACVAAASRMKTASSTSKRASKKKVKKLFESATLSNPQREVLHVEIYRYFKWLHGQLSEVQEEQANGNRLISRNGISMMGVEGILGQMEGAFRGVQNAKANDEEEEEEEEEVKGGGAKPKHSPLLEDLLVNPLAKLVDELQNQSNYSSTSNKRKSGVSKPAALDFEEMFGRLMEFKRINDHVDVPHKYKADPQLGQFVSNLRQKKKVWLKRIEENNLLLGEDEEGMMGGGGGGSGGTPKKRRGARQYLDDEKVRRLDEIGFTWAFKKVTKSWEERFEDLVQFRSENGHCNVPRGFGSLGEWVSCDVCHVDVLSN